MKKSYFTVLLYHGVDSGEDFYAGMNSHLKEYILTKELFENHIKYLYTNKFNVLSLDQCLEHMAAGAMPEKSVILTFDDGEKSCQRTIAPTLDRYSFKGEFFIVSGLIGKENYMDDNDLRELSGKGHGIQSHSVSHHPLTRLSDAQIYEEMKKSKEAIAAVTGKEAKFFSIPTGFYDKRVPDTARKTGYKALLCSVEGYNEVPGDHFLLKRFAIRSYTDVKSLADICENKVLTSCKLLAKRIFTKTLKFIFTFELYDKLRDRFLKRMVTIERK